MKSTTALMQVLPELLSQPRPVASPAPMPTAAQSEAWAGNLKEVAPAAYLYGSMGAVGGPAYGIECSQVYLRQLLEDAGSPVDPIERMLIEQLALAHHNIGRLHMRAAAAREPEEHKVLNAAAARLMGEFRRSALALKFYRGKGLSGIGEGKVADQPLNAEEAGPRLAVLQGAG